MSLLHLWEGKEPDTPNQAVAPIAVPSSDDEAIFDQDCAAPGKFPARTNLM